MSPYLFQILSDFALAGIEILGVQAEDTGVAHFVFDYTPARNLSV